MPVLTLGELGERFGLKPVGAPDTRIEGVCSLTPGRPGRLAFCADAKLRSQLPGTAAAAVVVGARDAQTLSRPGLVARDPAAAFARIAALWDRGREFPAGVHRSAVVDASAVIGEGAGIGAGAVIGADAVIEAGSYVGPTCVIGRGAVIGAGSRLEANVHIAAECVLGARVSILPGAVIGARGFGLVPTRDGWLEMPQLGRVVIGDDVEIGANTCIDRGALDDTVIEDGVKIDNQVQIAHNCRIGAGTAIAATVGIAGSTVIGRRCLIGGAVGIAGHITIVDDVVLLAGTMVSSSIGHKGAYGSTMTALPVRDWRKMVARFRRWSLVENRLRRIERNLKFSDQDNLTEGYGISEEPSGKQQDDA